MNSSELKLGLLVNTNSYGKNTGLAQQLHLLSVRLILYFLYDYKDVFWGYYLFKGGTADSTSYKRLNLRNITVKDVQKYLSDLQACMMVEGSGTSGASSRSSCVSRNRSWEEVLTLLLSDFDYDVTSENHLFILTSSLPNKSNKVKDILKKLRKDKSLKICFVDTNWLKGTTEQLSFSDIGEATGLSDTILIYSRDLTNQFSHLWFREVLKYILNKESIAGDVIKTSINFGDRSPIMKKELQGIFPDDEPEVSIWIENITPDRRAARLPHKLVVLAELEAEWQDRDIDYTSPMFLTVDSKPKQEQQSTSTMSILAEDEDKNEFLISHLSSIYFVMYPFLSASGNNASAAESSLREILKYPLLSFHAVDQQTVELSDLDIAYSITYEDNLMKELAEFHTLTISTDSSNDNDVINPNLIKSNITTSLNCPGAHAASESNEAGENNAGSLLCKAATDPVFSCVVDELISLPYPTCFSRSICTSLIHKHEKDIKIELSSPTKIKQKYSGDESNDSVIKEHKIQIILALIEYCEASDEYGSDEDRQHSTMELILKLLRSLTFLTTPKEMLSFFHDKVVENFHLDCGEILREIFEDGLMLEPPDVLLSDTSNSLSSSILSTHRPLFCEDTSSQPITEPAIASSQYSLSRQRSWIDACQSSQNSFQICLPARSGGGKKKKKKLKNKMDNSKIAAIVCNKRVSGEKGSVRLKPNWTSELKTATSEERQSSKRRKLSRKNSVLDTPLKKQVRNPTTAKNCRARARIELTPQKADTSISHVEESPVRCRASSFFGSQVQPASLSFVVKDGFKTPTRSSFRSSPPDDTPDLFSSPTSETQSPSSLCFTPPHPPSSRKYVKKLSYSPMRPLFSGTPSKRHYTDYINLLRSPSTESVDKENDMFLPALNLSNQDSRSVSPISSRQGGSNSLELIHNPDFWISEDTQMPGNSFDARDTDSTSGMVTLQTTAGLLKMIETSDSFFYGRRASDEESDVSVTSHRSILKSPHSRSRSRKKRNVSFSLDYDKDLTSDNESTTGGGGGGPLSRLIDIIDASIQNDSVNKSEVQDSYHQISLSSSRDHSNDSKSNNITCNNPISFYGKRKRSTE